MTENFEQIRQRHEREIEELQANCQHEKVSKWMDYMWAPGHFGGQVRHCLFCGKVIGRSK